MRVPGGPVHTMPTYTQHDNYEEITLSSDEWHEITVGTDETLENKLIDCTADGAHVQIHADGANWSVRNIGITGRVAGDPDDPNAGVATMTFAVDNGSTATVENIYMGDGCEPDSNGEGWASGYFVHRHHEGTLTIRNVNLQEFANNGMYASAAGYPDDSYAEGAVHVEEVYVRDASVSGIRPGSPDSYVDTARIYQQGNGPVNTNGDRWRGIWTWYHGGIELRNVHIDTTEAGDAALVANANAPSDAVTYVIDSEIDGYTNAANGSIDETNVGSNPLTAEPDYVPSDALSAADGSFAGDGTDTGGDLAEVSAPDALRIRTPAGIEHIPTYKPSELSTPALTFTVPDGNGGVARTAVRLADPTANPARAIRVNTPNGIMAVSMVSGELLEGFEDGTWPDDWTGETTYYDLATGSDAIRGDYSITTNQGSSFAQIANANISTPRGHTYTVRVIPGGTEGEPWFYTNVQDTRPAYINDAAYVARLRPANNELALVRRDGGLTTLDTVSVSVSTGTEYQLALDVRSDDLRARVFDATGTELAATSYVTDTSLSGGYIGGYVGRDDSAGTTFDQFEQHPLGTL